MNALKIIGAVLIAAGLLGLAYGGFSYMQASEQASIGPLHIQVNRMHSVAIPVWLSVAAVAAGVVILVSGRSR